MRRWPAVLLLAAGVLFPGCGTVMASETMITFFYVLNTSGRDVRVRVSADGRELFVVALAASRRPRAGAEEAPPRGAHPARELKVPLSRDARQLVLEETGSAARTTFEIPRAPRSEAGFRITVGPRGISVDRDSMPIR